MLLGLCSLKNSLPERVKILGGPQQTPGPHSSQREPGLLAQYPQGYPLFSLWGYLQVQPQNFSFWTLPSLGTQFSSKLPHSEIVPVLFLKYL